MVQLGGKFMVLQVGALMLFVVPALVLSTTIGAAALTPYNLCQRIFGILWMTQQIVMTPLRAAYSEALGNGDHRWIRVAYRWSLLGSVVVALVFCGTMIVWGGELFWFWTGAAEGLPTQPLIVAFAIWTLIIAVANPPSNLLNGLSRLDALVIYASVTSLLVVPAMVYGASHYGAVGVVFALVVSYAVCAFPAVFIDTELLLRHPPFSRKLESDGIASASETNSL